MKTKKFVERLNLLMKHDKNVENANVMIGSSVVFIGYDGKMSDKAYMKMSEDTIKSLKKNKITWDSYNWCWEIEC